MDTWNALAKCLHDPRIHTDFFFPDLPPRTPAGAKLSAMIATYCADCPVRRECEREGASENINDGYWGGKAAHLCKP